MSSPAIRTTVDAEASPTAGSGSLSTVGGCSISLSQYGKAASLLVKAESKCQSLVQLHALSC